MTEQEHSVILAYMKEMRSDMTEVRGFMRNISEKVQKIERGMYGEGENGTPGLIQRQALDEQRITKIESKINRGVWFLSGILVSIEVAWQFIKQKFKL